MIYKDQLLNKNKPFITCNKFQGTATGGGTGSGAGTTSAGAGARAGGAAAAVQ